MPIIICIAPTGNIAYYFPLLFCPHLCLMRISRHMMKADRQQKETEDVAIE